MKKDTSETKSFKPMLINIGLAIMTLIVSGAIGYFLILPTFSELSKINQEISAEKAQADKINQSVSNLKSQDKTTLATLSATLRGLIPTQIDMLHFASLNEVIAKSVGAEISNIQLSKSIPKSAKTADTKATIQTIALSVISTYKSNFDSLLNLIRAWMQADQEVGIKTILISGDTSGIVTYTVTYDLPTSQNSTTVTVDDQLTLSKKQIDELKAVKSKIIYTATPSAKPLGRDNPFSQ